MAFIQAGGEEMGKFGFLTVINELAGRNVLKWEEVMKIENSTALIYWAMEAERAMVEKRMSEI